MDEKWIEISMTDWYLDNGVGARKKLNAMGYEPVEPLKKKDIPERPAFMLLCKKIKES